MKYGQKLLYVLILGCLLFYCSSISASELDNNVSNALNENTVVVLCFYDDALTSSNVVLSNLRPVIDSYGDDAVLYFEIDILNEDSSQIIDDYSIEITPTVLVFDELGRIYEDIFGIKSSDYYENSIFEAMKVDNTLIYNANKYYENGQHFYESLDFEKANYYFLQAEAIYTDLEDVSNRLLCQLYSQKCESYLSAYEFYDQAELYFSLNDFENAQENYSDSIVYFEKVGDSDMINYCTNQIEYCILYPTFFDLHQESLSLMSQNNYTSAIATLTELKSGYDQVGDSEQSAYVYSLITKCNDYIVANEMMSEGTSNITNKSYQDAITSFSSAKEIYSEYMDYEKVAICDQNIAVSQQFLDLTPSGTDDGVDEETDKYPIEKKYIYAIAGLLLILIVVIGIIKKSSKSSPSGTEKIYPPPPLKRVEIVPDEEVNDYDEVAYQSLAIEKKNELLEFFASWIEDLHKSIKNIPPGEREHARASFDEMSKVFLKTFNKDEIYLDQEMLYNAFINLHDIQLLLAE